MNPLRQTRACAVNAICCHVTPLVIAFFSAITLQGCSTPDFGGVPQRARVVPGQPVAACAELPARISQPALRITEVQTVAAGSVRVPGLSDALPEHCLLRGRLNERIGPVDGKAYAIGFEMRLPTDWNGRFFYQANGGLDGFVTPAFGDILGGGPTTNGLAQGYAVISSDAGHAFDRSTPTGGALFGLDPQARRDYGYNAVAQLTPLAKGIIKAYYGHGPGRSYFVGTSNGGRHGFVTAARLPDAYDGILVSTPGYRLPRAAVAQIWGAQQFASVSQRDAATGRPQLRTSFVQEDFQLVAQSILRRCDDLDGLADGIVSDPMSCQRVFRAQDDLPRCADATPVHQGACLSGAQIDALARVLAGPVDRQGRRIYAPMAWDPGMAGRDWANWKLDYSVGPRDAIALAFVMTTPPASPAIVNGQGTSLIDYAMAFPLDQAEELISATNATYTESALQFMTPPDATFRDFVARGGRIIVFHGMADPVFSPLDSVAWYEGMRKTHGNALADHARLYLVPGMNHSRGGPSTDQINFFNPLVQWVEEGIAPGAVTARARGATSALPNTEIPASWNPARTRLLCPYPQVARYQSGAGADPESAQSFACTGPEH